MSDRVSATTVEAVPLRGELVYARLRADLQSGRLSPGSRLREVDLAQRLNVSRTPVREALKRLESEGLVTFVEARGLIVTELSPDQVVKLYAMRELVEGAAARFAAEAASAGHVRALEEIYAQALTVADPDGTETLNRRFHETIRIASGNEYLQKSAGLLEDSMLLLGGSAYSVPGRVDTARREHAAILDAVKRRDPDKAERAMREHVRISTRLRLAIMFGQDAPDRRGG